MANQSRLVTSRLALAIVLGAIAPACDCSDSIVLGIRITQPSANQRYTDADDQDPDRPGLQVDVVAQGEGIGSDTVISLHLDENLTPIDTAQVDDSGEVHFANVTLPPGTHRLQARTLTGGVRSAEVTYTYTLLVIEDPTSGQQLSFEDDERPSQSDIQYTVTVQTYGLSEDDTVRLSKNDSDIATANPDDTGRVTFPAVTFETGNHTLRAAADDVQSAPVSVEALASCGTLSFLTPGEPESGTAIVLGPSDDTDGDACGSQFTTSVRIGADMEAGATVELFVNGNSRGTATVRSALVTFDQVVLGNRGDRPNTLAVQATTSDGTVCPRVDFPTDLFVHCEGPSCEITAPTGRGGYLSSEHDLTDAPGLQTNVVVTASGAALNQPVRLIIDGDVVGAPQENAIQANGEMAVATFQSITLNEGERRVQALCRDALGNETLSGQLSWTVDITPCALAITSPEAGQLFITEDDSDDDPSNGVQVDLSATVGGDDCVQVRMAECSGLSDSSFTTLESTTPTMEVTLVSAPSQELCAEVRDAAGNATVAQVAIQFVSDAPQVAIVSPTAGTRYNQMGGTFNSHTYVADLNSATPACEIAVQVQCSDTGSAVTLHRSTGAQLAGGTAPCTSGTASFASVVLPRTGTPTIHARQTAADGRLLGISPSVGLHEDCQPPNLGFSSLGDILCGEVLSPLPGEDDIIRDIFITNDDPTGAPTVTLTIEATDGSSTMYEASSQPPANFRDIEFSFGEFDIVARATDGSGNVGTTPECQVTVLDVPFLAVTVAGHATSGGIIGPDDDCDPAREGLQILISAVTDAPDGSIGRVQVGSLPAVEPPPTVVGGEFSLCTDAPQGQPTIVVEVTDDEGEAARTARVQLTPRIDSMPPLDAIADLTVVGDNARAGTVTFEWTSVVDQAPGRLDAYHMRCAAHDIVDESGWSTADSLVMTTTPAETADVTQTDSVSGFRIGEERWCALRASDIADSLTPLDAGSSVQVAATAFRSQTLPAPDGAPANVRIGRAITPVGSINGDTIADLLVTGFGRAYIYFGTSNLAEMQPNVTLVGPNASFGRVGVGLGDFNGDGRPDMAISAPTAGMVYVLFGRAADNPWPIEIEVGSGAAGDCGADVCIDRPAGASNSFGFGLAALGDYDGDGLADLAIGEPASTSFEGRVYIVRGRGVPSGTTLPLSGAGATGGFVVTPPTGQQFQLGNSVAGLGDVSGDGRADLVIGAPGWASPVVNGRVFSVLGREYPDAATGLIEIATTAAGVREVHSGPPDFAQQVYAVGNLVGDSNLDIAVRRAAATGNEGLYIYPGAGGGEFNVAGRITMTTPANDKFGASVAQARHPALSQVHGRIDTNSRPELLVGQGKADPNATAATLHMFYDDAFVGVTAVSRDAATVALSEAVNTPRTVRYVGDLNNDGHMDICYGDPDANGGIGQVVVLY